MKTIVAQVEMSRHDLLESISSMAHEEVEAFITDLDLMVQDYDFTKGLIEKLQASLAEDDAVSGEL